MIKITPLFSKPLIELNINIDTKQLQQLFKEFKLESHNNSELVKLTKDMNVLKKFKELKKIFKKIIKDVNERVWKIDTELMITTSWLTKTYPEGESAQHNHLNSLISGVFYFDNSSPIIFSQPRSNTIYADPTEYNVYNSSEWVVHPKRNDLILFPSELTHRIDKNKTDKIRYSLAFNVLPKGLIGYKDSKIRIGEI